MNDEFVRNLRLCAIALSTLALSATLAPSSKAQNPEMQQRFAEVKEASARNKQLLAQYTWMEQVTISLKGEWRTIASSAIDPLARTATFRIPKWTAGSGVPYRVTYKMGREYTFEGTIPKDPVDKPKIGRASCRERV